MLNLMRTGYAIESDMIMPHQLRATLETKKISGLFYSWANKWDIWL